MPEFGLINMNGRLYDPALGRFLGPDILNQDPTNTQSYNRYSYCLNNPLKYTDPSGWTCGWCGGPCGPNQCSNRPQLNVAPIIQEPIVRQNSPQITGPYIQRPGPENISMSTLTGEVDMSGGSYGFGWSNYSGGGVDGGGSSAGGGGERSQDNFGNYVREQNNPTIGLFQKSKLQEFWTGVQNYEGQIGLECPITGTDIYNFCNAIRVSGQSILKPLLEPFGLRLNITNLNGTFVSDTKITEAGVSLLPYGVIPFYKMLPAPAVSTAVAETKTAATIALEADIVSTTDEITTNSATLANKIEQHHLLPKYYKQYFKNAGLDIENFKIPLSAAKHRLRPNGVHTINGGNWNAVWREYIINNPFAKEKDILNQLSIMRKDFGI